MKERIENKCARVWRRIHEMQICDRINDRSIFSYLISISLCLIVLLFAIIQSLLKVFAAGVWGAASVLFSSLHS